MTDHTYYMSALNQNIGYNQPNNLGYYLGSDMDRTQVPLTTGIGSVIYNRQPADGSAATGVYNLAGQKVADNIGGLPAGLYIVNGHKAVVK